MISQKGNYKIEDVTKKMYAFFYKGGWNLLISNSFWEEGPWLKPMCKENICTDS